MDLVIIWLVRGILLAIGLLIIGIMVERTINRRADAALSNLDDRDRDEFTIWVRSLALGNPRLLAVILRSPFQLCYIIAVLLTLVIPPFSQPQPIEVIESYLFLMLFAPFLFWLSNVIDKARELRKKADKLRQKTNNWEISCDFNNNHME